MEAEKKDFFFEQEIQFLLAIFSQFLHRVFFSPQANLDEDILEKKIIQL